MINFKELADVNSLKEPYQLSVGQKLLLEKQTQTAQQVDTLQINKPVSGVKTTTRVELKEIVVGRGDTLYSISRKYSVPVNDLAVMNNLRSPFNLKVGQKIKVPLMIYSM